MAIEISNSGTLILPVQRAPLELPATFVLGATELVAKAELHVTVFNYPIGKLVKKASKADPGFPATIEAEARATAWNFTLTGALVHLVQGEPRPLQTLVALLDSTSIAAFFAAIRERVPNDGELAEALAHPPPPHVTLFTSDPAGKAGIGLYTCAALDDARARALRGEEGGLLAHAIPAGALAFAQARLALAE